MAKIIRPNDYFKSLPKHETLPAEADKCDLADSSNLAHKVQEYSKNGVVLFEQVLPVSLIDLFEQDLSFIRRNRKNLAMIKIDGKRHHYRKTLADLNDDEIDEPGLKLVSVHQYSQPALDLALNETIQKCLSLIFDAAPALLQSLTFYKSSEQSIHQDFPYVYQQRDLAKLAACWIPLEDIHPDSGPLQYYLGSHKVAKYGFYDWGDGAICLDRDSRQVQRGISYREFLQNAINEWKFEKKIYTPRKGDLLIWHGALIHGGTPMINPELTRKSLVCHYTSLEAHPSLRVNDFNNVYAFEMPNSVTLSDLAKRRSDLFSKIENKVKGLQLRLQLGRARLK
jgi:phytanoyl-CoA hydroxylase